MGGGAAGLACWRQRGHLTGKEVQNGVSGPKGGVDIIMVESWPHRGSWSPCVVRRAFMGQETALFGASESKQSD